MGILPAWKKRIRLNARLVMREMKHIYGVNLSLDESSTAWADAHIAVVRENLDPAVGERLVQVFGSFFGECLRRSYRGRWKMAGGEPSVSFGRGRLAYPFNKVRKHFASADGESILSLFRSIPLVMPGVQYHPLDERSGEIAQLLQTLQAHEYFGRKYRFHGDCYSAEGRDRDSVESHRQANLEESQARGLVEALTARFGPPGELVIPPPGELAVVRPAAGGRPDPWSDDPESYEDACFFARRPNWAICISRLAAAHARWKDDPRFVREAPLYRPVNPAWRP